MVDSNSNPSKYHKHTVIFSKSRYRKKPSWEHPLKAANHLIAHNQVRVKKKMKTDNGAGEPIQVLVAQDEFE